MNVVVVYCYPILMAREHYPMAARFARTYQEHPPDYPHRLIVGCNGGEPDFNMMRPFTGIPHEVYAHDNRGWDIGLYQRIGMDVPCELLICLGAHIQFHKDNWLSRAVNAVLENGPGLYGPWGAQYPQWHIRTTAFWCQPEILNSYPVMVGSGRASRYQFEHGAKSMTRHTLDLGFPAVMVTTEGCFHWPDWPNHMPDKSTSILLDKQHA